jgi:hypothetical protein
MPANPQLIEEIRAELLLAVKQARREARRILESSTEAPFDGLAPCLSGEGSIAPSVSSSNVKLPTHGDELTGNPEYAHACRPLGTGRRAVDVDPETPIMPAALYEGLPSASAMRRPLGMEPE